MVRGQIALKAGAGPCYPKLADFLMESIRDGRWIVGAALPTEEELCETFGVSRHTTREALRQSEDKGLITRRKGSGSTVVVTSPPVRYEQNIQTIEDMLQHGNTTRLHVLSSKVQSRKLLDTETAAHEIVPIVDIRKINRIEQAFSAVNVAPAEAKILHMKAGEAVFQCQRLSRALADNDAVARAYPFAQIQLCSAEHFHWGPRWGRSRVELQHMLQRAS